LKFCHTLKSVGFSPSFYLLQFIYDGIKSRNKDSLNPGLLVPDFMALEITKTKNSYFNYWALLHKASILQSSKLSEYRKPNAIMEIILAAYLYLATPYLSSI
jgi:hypothetical protein